MLKKLCCCLMLVAVLGSLNVHWAAIQGYAWITMLQKERAKSETMAEAMDRTFSGNNPCELCKLVERKQTESEPAHEVDTQTKIKLLPLPSEGSWLASVRKGDTHWTSSEQAVKRSLKPESPPPRI